MGTSTKGGGVQSGFMRRRDFIAVISGAAAVWPLAARAQRKAMPVIGFLDPRSSTDSFSDQIAGFHRGLKDIDFVENDNVAIEYAWGNDQFDRLPALAAELVSRPVAVLVASGGSRVASSPRLRQRRPRSSSPWLKTR
jgi:putative tryptophan/tyrosine transport system substrate-binding protein